METTLQDIINWSEQLDENKFDIFASIPQLNWNSGSTFSYNEKYGYLEEHAYYQMWHRLMDTTINNKPKIFSNSVIRHFWDEPELGDYAHKYHLNIAIDNNFPSVGKILCWRMAGMDCRAVLSDQYGSILNTELVKALQLPLSALSETPRIITHYITRDNVMIQMLYKDYNAEDGSYGAGIYICNDEIGKGALKLGTIIKRGFCDNTCILQNVRTLYHRNNIYDRLQTFLPEFSIALKETEQYIYRIEELKNIKIPNFTEELEKFAKKYQLDLETMVKFEQGMEGEYNMYGWMNGITTIAKEFALEKREFFQSLAGDLVMKSIKLV